MTLSISDTAEPQVLGVAAVAALLGLDPATVRSQVRLGTIPSTRVGQKILIPRAWVESVVRAEPSRLAVAQ